MKISILFIINVQMLSSTIFIHSAMVQKLSQFQFCLMNINQQLPQNVELNYDEKESFDRIKKAIMECNGAIEEHFHQNWVVLTQIIDSIGTWFGTNLGMPWWAVTSYDYELRGETPKYPKKSALQLYIKNFYQDIIKKLEALSTLVTVSIIKNNRTIDTQLTPIQEHMFRWLQKQIIDLNQEVRQKIYDSLKIINGKRDAELWKPMLTLNSSTDALGKKEDWEKLGLLDEYNGLRIAFMNNVARQLLAMNYSQFSTLKFPSSPYSIFYGRNVHEN